MIDLRTLGALELTSTGGNTCSSILAQPRRAALLCYLALGSPRGFRRRDSLLALFWPEHDAEHARHALRQSLYFLRRALGPGVIVSRGDDELALASGPARCDVWEFEAALDQGRAVEALALYRGDLLPGFHISNAPDFERWLEAERGRLRERATEAAWTLAGAREHDGDAAGAVEAGRRAVALAPTDEIGLRRLLLVLERFGDGAGAVRAYEAFAAKLREEYELRPSPDTQRLVARIRAERVERPGATLGPGGRPSSGSRGESHDAGSQDPQFGRVARLPARPPEPGLASTRSRTVRPGKFVAATLTVVLLLGLAGLRLQTRSGPRTADRQPLPIGERAPALAVLPFAVQDDALANWREGLMDLVSMNLSGVPGLHLVESRTLLARWREQVVGTETPMLATALDVAARAGGRYAAAGSVIADGPDLLLTARVYQVAGHRLLGIAKSRGPAESIFTLVDQLTLEILRVVPGDNAHELPRIDLAGRNTASLPALKAYLQGEVHFRQSRFEAAAEAYGRAVEADSTFALARYRLGFSRQWFWTDLQGSVPDPLAPAVGELAGRLPQHEAVMFRAFQLRERDVLAARELLEEEVRRHPHDADTWYQLGELYHHSGDQALVPRGAADLALARAIALDSTFSLPYIHRIEVAINSRDTAATYRLLRTFGRLAPGTRYLAQLRLLADLTLGDPSARSTSEAGLDTLEIQRLFWLGMMLAETRYWDRSEQMFRKVRDRGEFGSHATVPLFFTSLAQGKAREAHRWLDDPFTPQFRKAAMLQVLAEAGAPATPAELDSALTLHPADSADAVQLFHIGGLAASQGRWPVFQASLDRLRARGRSLRAADDSSEVDFTEAVRQGLEGYWWWHQGQRDRALHLLQLSQRRALGRERREVLNATLRWWLGRLLVEMARPREALPYFESLTGSYLPGDYERGRLYERLRMVEQAREAYALFLVPRQQADPVFQRMIQSARAAPARLAQATE